ncbi:MAG: MBL fold metallo-hydrolase [Thermoplasmatota archaeon]
MSERIRKASAVVLYPSDVAPTRDAPVYLVLRSPTQRFFPGYWAFPGGTLEEGEDFATAAVRELEEETGVRLGGTHGLVSAGHLVTPKFAPTRYDTQFYVAALPKGQEPHVTEGELVEGRWFRPSEALDAFAQAKLMIPPPVVAMLTAYRNETPRDAAARIAAGDSLPHHRRFAIIFHPGIATEPLPTATLPPATTTNCHILGHERLLVVDPGAATREDLAPAIERVNELAAKGARVEAIVLTHHHADHAAGADILAKEWGVPVAAHEETAKDLPGGVQRILKDGDRFDLGTDPTSGNPWYVDVVHAPGHTRGSIVLRDRRFGALLVGDVAAGIGTVIIDPPDGDMQAYFATLEKLIALAPPILLPGHGPALPKGTEALSALLAHRREREAKVVAALGPKPRSIESMLPAVYSDVDPSLHALGARSLLAHLLKLEKEGIAVQDGEGWRRH